MKLINKAITGQEIRLEEGTPYEALLNFYYAFNQQDFEMMSKNWMLTNESSMSNPLGGIKRGWNEIEEVYTKLFKGKAKVYVEFYDYSINVTENMFVAVGREKGFLEMNNEKIELAIRTSRTYRLFNNQWKQIHHHGSMDDPELLERYQSAVLNK